MSLEVFKTNMLMYMQNQSAIKSHDAFVKKLTMEYDMAIRRGYQTINKVMVQKPNTELMENMIKIAGIIAQTKKSGLHDIINQYGKGIEMYWLGATLYQFPVPIIPAIGAFQNIMTTSANVTNPGKFPDMKQQYPTTNSKSFIDMLTLGIQIHLLSIEGTYNTISMYPGFPIVPPAPGIVKWTGYTIPS